MAMAIPFPFPGLSAVLAAYGKLFCSRGAYSLPPDDRPTITAVIPALNEEQTVPYALTSLATQTVPPDRVVVVDDGSTDDTARIVAELGDELDLNVELRRHDDPMGKTVGVKAVARSVETDTLFVLDADTFLTSEDYLERLLAPHADPSVASSFGTVYPITDGAKRTFYDERMDDLLPDDGVARERVAGSDPPGSSPSGPLAYLRSWKPIVQFRNVNYHVEQRFFMDGAMRLFGSTLFPVGCGALYDRRKLVSVFDDYEESLGDDLTNSEDIFLGFAFCDRGWENVHVDDTYVRSTVPGFRRTLEQNYLWGSGYLQSAYYFGRLSLRLRKRRVAADGGVETTQTTTESEDEDESSGEDEGSGEDDPDVVQPMGRLVLARIIDGLYPTTVLVLLALSMLGVTALELAAFLVLWELTLYVVLGLATRSERVGLLRNLVPFVVLRMVTMPVGTYTYLRVFVDILSGNRSWRK